MGYAIAAAAPPETVLAAAAFVGASPHPADVASAAQLTRVVDRRARLAARILLRMCLAQLGELTAAESAFGRRCSLCDGWHGGLVAPTRPALGLSVTHVPGVVAAIAGPGAVAIDAAELELDAEGLATILHEAASPRERVLHAPAAWTWARKECLTKAGLVHPNAWPTADAERPDTDAPVSQHAGAGHWDERRVQAHAVVALATQTHVRWLSPLHAPPRGASAMRRPLSRWR